MITEESEELLGAQKLNAAILLMIETNPITRMWFGGFHRIRLPAGDTVDPDGGYYLGLGNVEDCPDLDIFINGGLERLEIVLSGVKAEHQALARAEASEVKYKRAHIGLMILNDKYRQASEVYWLKHILADTVRLDSAMTGDRQKVRQIALGLIGEDHRRRQPLGEYYTHAEQLARSPDDLFCQHVARYNAGATRKVP